MNILTDDGFGGKYEVSLVINNHGLKEFKVRSTSELSSMYLSDCDFESEGTMDLGYYESKMISGLGFSDEQINSLHNAVV